MNPEFDAYCQALRAKETLSEAERRLLAEIDDRRPHRLPASQAAPGVPLGPVRGFYDHHDLESLQAITALAPGYAARIGSLDELLERDRQREKDGFPRKINVGRLIKPGKGGRDKVVVVPTTVEEKLIHDSAPQSPEAEDTSGGSGDGQEGEVIGQEPVREAGSGAGAGPGQGEGGAHELESSAYDLGRILTEKFELPNLMDKGKKRALARYTYELTDRHRGFGQLLDKKATLRRILRTNISLGNVPDPSDIDPARFVIPPDDRVFRVLSKEKDYESQAMIFFLRDYSGSMAGRATELVVTQHVLIYSWLLYQYDRQVQTRFVLHDTEAAEVPDFYTYYNLRVAGGTQVAAAYRLVNEIVQKENLIPDYNIYIFHGTDGDDWDTEGKATVPELTKMLAYANRVGITIAEHGAAPGRKTEVEKYLRDSGLLTAQRKRLRLDVMQAEADEARLIEGIKRLTAEE